MGMQEHSDIFFAKKCDKEVKTDLEKGNDPDEEEVQLRPSSVNWTRRMSFT